MAASYTIDIRQRQPTIKSRLVEELEFISETSVSDTLLLTQERVVACGYTLVHLQ